MPETIGKITSMISTVKGYLSQIKRIWPDIVACCVVTGGLYTGIHEKLPPSLQLVFFKMVLVSMAFVHAHIVGKLAFGKVDWTNGDITPHKMLRVALYVSFIIAYSMGG